MKKLLLATTTFLLVLSTGCIESSRVPSGNVNKSKRVREESAQDQLVREGLAALKEGDLALAEAKVREADAMDPHSTFVKSVLGRVLDARGKSSEAKIAFDEAMQRDGDTRVSSSIDSIGMFRYSELCELSGDEAGARWALEQCVKAGSAKRKDLFDGNVNLPYIKLRARAVLAKAADLDALGDYKGAIAASRVSLQLDPEFIQARFLLGMALASHGSGKESLTELKRVAKSPPSKVQDQASRLVRGL